MLNLAGWGLGYSEESRDEAAKRTTVQCNNTWYNKQTLTEYKNNSIAYSKSGCTNKMSMNDYSYFVVEVFRLHVLTETGAEGTHSRLDL